MIELAVKKTVHDWFDPDALYSARNLLPNNERLVYISPENFLKLAKVIKNKFGYGKDKMKGVKKLIKTGTPFSEIPYLRIMPAYELDDDWVEHIIPDTGQVWGHEGRHRAMNLKALGWKKMPVILKFDQLNRVPKYIMNQDGTDTFLWTKVIKPYTR